MLREHARGVRGLLLATDVGLCAGIYALALWQFAPASLDAGGAVTSLVAGAVGCVGWPLLLYRRDLYTSYRRIGLGVFVGRMLGACAAAALLLSATSFALSAPVPAFLPAACAGLQGLALASSRLLGIAGLRAVRRHGGNHRNVLIVGSGARALAVWRAIEQNPHWGLKPLGFLDELELPASPEIPPEQLQPLKNLPDLFGKHVVDEVIVAWTRSMFMSMDDVVACCAQAGVPMTILSDFFGDLMPPPRASSFGPYPALSFATVHHSRSLLAVKRCIDVVGAAAGLVALAPVLLFAAAAIRLTSPGPVLFRQVRCGLYGRCFDMLKFRTMYVDAEERKQELAHLNEMAGPVFKIRNDPRVTRVGRILRRWSFDELPQLVNVLRGDMSLVGPRPPTVDEVDSYSVGQRRRLSMRPGITCLWQVSGRNGIASFEEWVKLDLEYIDGWSIRSDLQLLLRTVPAVLSGHGAS